MVAAWFDRLAHVVGSRSRRVALRTALGGATAAASGLLASAPPSHARKKCKKRKQTCPVCPPPPPVSFCAGKNQCAQIADRPCQASGESCVCWIRQDNATPFCGTDGPQVDTCDSCTAEQICVVLGGACASNFACVSPCPDPL
jgi:hypothetical protein